MLSLEKLTPHVGRRGESGGGLVSADSLRKDLEGELRLDSKDIRSYAWYHGRIPRDLSEQFLRNDGDFLIRESISSTGEHVLTMKWGAILHFKINKQIVQQSPTYSKVQFAFERDGFDSIPALIMFHKGNNIPISQQSGARILTPINRELPLSFSDVKYASLRRHTKPNGNVTTTQAHSAPSGPNNHRLPSPQANNQSAGFVLMETEPLSTPPNKASILHGSRISQVKEGNSPLSPQPFPLQLPEQSDKVEAKSDSIHKQPTSSTRSSEATSKGDTVGSLPSIKQKSNAVPPKPSRIPSFRRPVIKHEPFRNTKNNSSNLPRNSNDTPASGNHPSRSSVLPNSSTSPRSSRLVGSGSPNSTPMSPQKSMFIPMQFNSILLPEQNKPVDGDIMKECTSILLGSDSFRLARHITYIDCQVCRIAELGLEDIFLTKGKQFRQDLLERYQSLSFWVAVCVLRGGSNKKEKVDILNVFIKIANELVHSLRNIYGFSSVMHGLTCPQIRGLNDLWGALQHEHTNNAVTMENKLIPLMRLLDEGKGQISTATICIPHILPMLRYLENPLQEIPHSSPSARASDRKQLSASEGNMLGSVASEERGSSCWWANLPDDSFDSLMAQLSIARNILFSLEEFRATSSGKFKDFDKKPRIHEIFCTEFHLRLLWGHKGSVQPQKERYEKIDKLLTLTANRFTP